MYMYEPMFEFPYDGIYIRVAPYNVLLEALRNIDRYYDVKATAAKEVAKKDIRATKKIVRDAKKAIRVTKKIVRVAKKDVIRVRRHG
jgi:hypothetical protein